MSVVIATILATVLVLFLIWMAHRHSQGFRFVLAQDHVLVDAETWDSILADYEELRHGIEASGSLSQIAKNRPKVVRKADMRVGRISERLERIGQEALVE